MTNTIYQLIGDGGAVINSFDGPPGYSPEFRLAITNFKSALVKWKLEKTVYEEELLKEYEKTNPKPVHGLIRPEMDELAKTVLQENQYNTNHKIWQAAKNKQTTHQNAMKVYGELVQQFTNTKLKQYEEGVDTYVEKRVAELVGNMPRLAGFVPPSFKEIEIVKIHDSYFDNGV